MRSWSSLLAEGATRADEAILRRFVEASRRAEIMALVNSARSEAELGEADAAELALLEAVTDGAGHALERAWLGVERERHAAQQAAIARAANLLNATLELDEVVQTLCREARLALAADVVMAMFADAQGRLE